MMDTKAKIMQQMQQRGVKVTPLRAQTLDIVLRLDGVIKAYHVLAQMQLMNQKKVAPPTAYRALDFWAEHGILHKISAVNGYILCAHMRHECDHQCPNAHHHNSSFVLVCAHCGAVDEQSLHAEWATLHQAVKQTGFQLNREHIVLTGVCAQCAARTLQAA